MLEELIVKDYALIDRLSVEFDGGLNILTGETGAGKSIIIGALSFLLGGKADVEIIRNGTDEASVSAVIHLSPDNSESRAWLSARDIAPENDRVILRRNLKRTGRGSAYIQETPVSRADLAEFTGFLFDIHGQHEHQALMKVESHRRYLDRFAKIEDEVKEFTKLFIELTEKRKAADASREAEKGRDERLEMLRYAIEEIDGARPKVGECAALEEEAALLSSFEKLSLAIHASCALFCEDETNLLSLLRKGRGQLDAAAALDDKLSALAKRFSDLWYEAEDASNELRHYRDGLSFDPNRLEAIEERLALLFRLKKKYGEDEKAILDYRASAEAEIESLSRVEEDRARLTREIATLERELSKRALELTAWRTAASLTLGEGITGILSTLGMARARFSVSVTGKSEAPGARVLGPYGADEVEFLISANLGEPLKELSRIASGGELSRVMLAIKTILADSDRVETLVFDEIDTGIGGEVALSVGEHLSAIGKNKQLFCITHLASIAVRADNHLKVEKRIDGDRTVTGVVTLTDSRRREEIARMLAGDAAGAAALAHADELISTYARRN